MKRHLLYLIPVMVLFFSGCPVGLDYPLSKPGSEKIDEKLAGTWKCTDEGAEVISIRLFAMDNNSFMAEVLERGELYSLETDILKGYCSELGGKHFIFFQPEDESKYYHYVYWFDGKDLVTAAMSLLDGGIDEVKDTESLRKQVKSSFTKEGWADETQTWVLQD